MDKLLLYITKRATFCAAHNYPGIYLPRNPFEIQTSSRKGIYGANYSSYFSLAGEINSKTKMILPLEKFKDIINQVIVNEFDHFNLSDPDGPLAGHIAMPEKIAEVLFEKVSTAVNAPFPKLALKEVSVEDDRKIGGYFSPQQSFLWFPFYASPKIKLHICRGEGIPSEQELAPVADVAGQSKTRLIYDNLKQLMTHNSVHCVEVIFSEYDRLVYGENRLEYWVKFRFSMPHRLVDPSLNEEENRQLFSPCDRLHGHHFTLEIKSESKEFDSPDFRQQFVELVGQRVYAITQDLADEFQNKCGTCESLLMNEIWPVFSDLNIVSITLQETENNSVTLVDTSKIPNQ